MTETEYTDGSSFHSTNPHIYAEENSPEDRFFKKSSLMARVVYRNAHENADYPEGTPKHGTGLNFCKWIASEQRDTAEHFSFNGNLNGIIESRLEPHASVGWHCHYDTEEYYYVLQGSMYVECQDGNGNKYGRTVSSGDLHRVSAGMSHYAEAGADGVLFLAIIVKAE